MKTFGTLMAGLVLVAGAVPAHAQTMRSGSTNPESVAGFGNAVAIGDREVFVGESGNTIGSGAVYVYQNVGGEWTESAKLVPSDGTDGDGEHAGERTRRYERDVDGERHGDGRGQRRGARGAACEQ